MDERIGRSGYPLVAGDRYYSPAWLIEALVSRETFVGDIWEPAAGNGGMVDPLRVAGYDVLGSDIEPGRPDIREQDFLEGEKRGGMYGPRNVVSNPPFGVRNTMAVRFVAQALRSTQLQRGKVAMLLTVDFDSAPSRKHLFQDHPAFAAKYVLTRRIHWTNVDQKLDAKGRAKDPMKNHAWFVWQWDKRPGTPVLYDWMGD